jgi:small GTP-binding protein
MKLHLWDTSGSERYASITKGHYRNAHGAILVYDVTDLTSFTSMDLWLDEIRESADAEWKILLIPNKCDITNKEPRRREVPTSRAKEYADKRGLMFFAEWSAFHNLNIRRSIKNLTEEIYSVQSSLIKKGDKKIEGLKISDMVVSYTNYCNSPESI